MRTEALHTDAKGIDTLSDAAVLDRLLAGQVAALQAVGTALEDLARGAGLMAQALRGTGRLVYAGAGSSALMANADGLELAGTYGIDPARIVLCMAGGLPRDAAMPGETEDDTRQAARDADQVRADDVVIAVTASGRTPYTVEFARLAQARRARTICIANTPGAAIFAHADIAVCLPTPPELVAGSTRMGAGTAQKAALNLMSTLMGIRLGHVYDGMMVNLRADNTKLNGRAAAIVSRIAGVPEPQALSALRDENGSVKCAILRLAGAGIGAQALLHRHRGDLRAALNSIQDPAQTGANSTTRMERTQ